MEDIKLWELDGTQAKPLEPKKQLELESLLEDILVKNPDLLIKDLKLVGRQTSTEGGPLDLLGIDPEDGNLVVFELKRGRLSRDAVAQIIDYASALNLMGLDDLAEHIAERSGERDIEKIENFQERYGDELESLKQLRLVLVGLGADPTTERMVRFLAQNSGLDISLLTFHAFDHNGKTILAKQVAVDAAGEPDRGSTNRRRTRVELERDFEEKIERFGTRDLVDDARHMFSENWPESTVRIEARGRSIHLGRGRDSRRATRIDTFREHTISIAFFSETKALCLDEFRELVRDIEYRIEPRSYRGPADAWKNPETDIHFHLNRQEWELHRERLTTLVQAVYAAWQNQDEDTEAELLS
ncbi:MAG: DUF91 domain-containing protein [Dehalococcoidia bacterium]|nr:DUF91 domain-containing protein [Dehalococcoidia bacterium]